MCYVFQVDNEYGGKEAYTDRVTNHLVPCIVQMTVASHDDSLWRSLNYQVCLKTRSSDPKVSHCISMALLISVNFLLHEDDF